ncbi:MAG: hypothetical protein OJF49_001160 [Ktedonobacterales bacterium]|jgi:steroid delta-isomerase-like uncharacterized protein|nr:MAG: hypothetical protein OJF49_001160 [Ktedonobacterales bacterium]
MPAEENKVLARRFIEECFNKGNLNSVDELVATNYVDHDPSMPGGIYGPSGVKQFISMYRTAFPDLAISIDELYAIGENRVMMRWTARGTHRGTLQGIPATGKQATVSGMTLSRYENGKGVEDYNNWDTLGLMQQLGVIPMASQPTMGTGTQPSPH